MGLVLIKPERVKKMHMYIFATFLLALENLLLAFLKLRYGIKKL